MKQLNLPSKQRGFLQFVAAGFISSMLAAIPLLFRYLFSVLPAIIVYIMSFLGIAAVSYAGVELVLSGIETLIDNETAKLPYMVYEAMKMAQFDKALVLFISMVTFKINFNLLKSFKTKYRVTG